MSNDTVEPISEIPQLNDLRMRCLRGEDIPPEQYLEVLVHVRKVRREKGDPPPAAPQKAPLDKAKLFSTFAKKKEGA